MTKSARFEIGTTFIPKSDKNKRVHTVVDILTVTNHKGEVVRIEYVARYQSALNPIDVVVGDTTIARGLVQA